jgi:16S rRNA (guanine(966)-N(2))-methyltransferase RsmD
MRIVAGTARGRKIEAPPGNRTRPTLDRVRENLFNMLQGCIQDSRVLDLFAGSGALSLEAISRGADSAVMVDSDRRASAVQKSNAEHLGFSNQIRFFCCDWHQFFSDIDSQNELFDLVFLDPPYAMTDMKEVFQALIPVINADTYIILEHQSNIQPSVPDCFEVIKQRSWGFCSVNIYRMI